MANTKLNILPVPTFAHLGVNFVERNIEAYETENIDIPANEEKDIIQYYDTDNLASQTVVTVGDNAKVRLVQVFEKTKGEVSKISAQVSENAHLNVVQVYIGGDSVSEIHVALNGRKASFTSDIGYILDGEDRLDINLIADHFGRKSTSDIIVNGVLTGNSKKTFKGTIDFKNGSVGAKGGEIENVLLLSESVRNRTVPVILCSEEDVEGSHGATVGKLDDKHIFYMKSRGIPEEKVYELTAKSRLMQVINKIGDDDTKSRIFTALGWGEENE